jgi:hypothetical protein
MKHRARKAEDGGDIPKDRNLHSHRCENLKSNNEIAFQEIGC